MAVIAIDGIARIIDLDTSSDDDIQRIYSEFANQHALNNSWEPAFATVAQLPDIPVTATLINNWKIRCQSNGAAYTKVIGGGVLKAETGNPFENNGGVEPRIIYNQPTLAVGYSTGGAADISAELNTINEGVQKASRLIPHTDDL